MLEGRLPTACPPAAHRLRGHDRIPQAPQAILLLMGFFFFLKVLLLRSVWLTPGEHSQQIFFVPSGLQALVLDPDLGRFFLFEKIECDPA